MRSSLFASVALSAVYLTGGEIPSRCPWCPTNTDCHWIRWGFYRRYAEGHTDRIRIQRYRCRITRHTFSLLPDALLPYRAWTTTHILRWLYAMVVERSSALSVAREQGLLGRTMRLLRARFRETVPQLRLPGHPAAFSPVGLLRKLAALTLPALASLFRDWKETEPKHWILGIRPR